MVTNKQKQEKGKHLNSILIMLLIILSVVCDSLRDLWMPLRCDNMVWWEWHLVKWCSMYSLWILAVYQLWKEFKIKIVYKAGIIMLLAVLCNIIWKLIYNY